MQAFDWQKDIRHYLTQEGPVFPKLVQSLEAHYSRAVGDVLAMKERDSKRNKGNDWENFCLLWLESTGKYLNVWKYSSAPEEIRKNLRLKGRQDNGIDLIAQTKSGFVAVQCKYRKRGRVTWYTLSTFIALCVSTGPWEQHLVMTNGNGCSFKVQRGPKDRTCAVGTFNRTKREVWMRMGGVEAEGRKIGSDEPKPKTAEELREARLKRFG